MEGNIVVVDASAIAAVIFNEPNNEHLWSIIENRELIAPSLLPYEITNVALKKIVLYPNQAAQLSEITRLLDYLVIEYLQVPMAGMVELASQTGLTSYDAAYLWLSLEFDVPLITLDKDLDSTARRLRIHYKSR